MSLGREIHLLAHSVTLFLQPWLCLSLWSERTGWVLWSSQHAMALEDGVPSLAGVSLLASEGRQESEGEMRLGRLSTSCC